jgi:hypothetical protein
VAVWWVLGAGEVAVFLQIATNLLKRRGVVGCTATNLTNGKIATFVPRLLALGQFCPPTFERVV